MAATTTILLPSHTPHIRANRVVADVVHESDETKCNRYEDPEECLRELKLFHGDFLGSLNVALGESRDFFLRGEKKLTKRRVIAALDQRSILLALEGIEGWVVSFSRWFLQAATTSGETTHQGPVTRMLERCHPSIDPPVRVLVDRVRNMGVVRRSDIAKAMVQCASHQKVWHELHRTRGASVNERNRFGWRPLHYAAALGVPLLIEELVELGAVLTARTFTGATALHIAAAHGAVASAGALVNLTDLGFNDWTGKSADYSARYWEDEYGRTPLEVGLFATGADVSKCAALRKALQGAKLLESLKARKASCAAAIAARRQNGTKSLAIGKDVVDSSWDAACPHEDDRSRSNATTGHPLEGAVEILDATNLSTHELARRYLSVGAPVLVRNADRLLPPAWRLGSDAREPMIERMGDVQLPIEVYPYAAASASLVGVANNFTTLGEMLSLDGPHSIFRCSQQQEDNAASGASSSKPRKKRKKLKAIEPPPPLSVFKALKGWRSKSDPTPSTERNSDHKADIQLTLSQQLMDGKVMAGAGKVKAVDMYAGINDQMPREDSEYGEPGGSNGNCKGNGICKGRDNSHKLLYEWTRPEFIHDKKDEANLLRSVSLQFYAGGEGAGAQPHWHGPAWNWLFRGRKQWLLWPPEHATYAQRHVTLALKPSSEAGGRPIVVDQEAGEVLVLPALWGHATLNHKPSIGFATELHFDRSFDLGFGTEFGDEWWRVSEDPNAERPLVKADPNNELSDVQAVKIGVDANGNEILEVKKRSTGNEEPVWMAGDRVERRP